MTTIREYISEDENKNKHIFERAGTILKEGGLVAFPTETVYGLGADAMNPEACRRIYKAKGRPSDNPLIVHAKDKEAAFELAEFDGSSKLLAERFWPGPLTLVLKRRSRVTDVVTGGLDTVAVRVPSHKTASGLLEVSGLFIAAPSANLSGRPSPTDASHVIQDLEGAVDMIIVHDSSEIGLESTIVDMTADEPVILRPGYVTKEQLEAVLGRSVSFADHEPESGGPKAPGMKYRHYAPRAELFLINGPKEESVLLIKKMANEAVSKGKKTFILTFGAAEGVFDRGEVINLGKDPEEASAGLFKALRKCDDEGADMILSEGTDDTGVGKALMNRLIKAAGNNIINL